MNDTFSSISLLIVFLTVFLDVVHKDVTASLKELTPPKEQRKARKTYLNELLRLLILKCLPIALSFILLFYLLLPKAIEIMGNSSVVFWQFDLDLTLFIFIEAAIFAFALLSINLTIRIILRISNIL